MANSCVVEPEGPGHGWMKKAWEMHPVRFAIEIWEEKSGAEIISTNSGNSHPSRACSCFTGLLINFRDPCVWGGVGDHCWRGKCLTVWSVGHLFLKEKKTTRIKQGYKALFKPTTQLHWTEMAVYSPCFPLILPSCQTCPWTLHPAETNTRWAFNISLDATLQKHCLSLQSKHNKNHILRFYI